VNRTRLSLYYLAAYLLLGGVGLLFLPRLSTRILFSNTEYPDVMLQVLGMFMVGLSGIVAQIIRLQITALYPTTIVVRLFFCGCLFLFYFSTLNPFFLVLLGIVGLGVLLTGISYFSERPKRATS